MSKSKWQKTVQNAVRKLNVAQLQEQGVINAKSYEKSYQNIITHIDKDISRLQKNSQTIFGAYAENKMGENGAKFADLFDDWRQADAAPSVPAILLHAADVMGIDQNEPSLQAAIMTGIAAEIGLENSYHDNNHFREVVTAALRYCVTNNDMASAGNPAVELMDGKDIAKTLLAAAGHDLNHDGTGNHENGSHQPYRLEQKSLDAMLPYMMAAGMAKSDIKDVDTAIYVTDVSQPREGISPHAHLKNIAKSMENGTNVDIKTIPSELHALTKSKKLLQMAAILSDADLTPSAGTTYDFNQKMTERLHGEVPAIAVGPDTTQFFCQQIVGGEFTSAAGKAHSKTSLNGLIDKATKLIQKRENTQKIDRSKANKNGTSNKI